MKDDAHLATIGLWVRGQVSTRRYDIRYAVSIQSVHVTVLANVLLPLSLGLECKILSSTTLRCSHQTFVPTRRRVDALQDERQSLDSNSALLLRPYCASMHTDQSGFHLTLKVGFS